MNTIKIIILFTFINYLDGNVQHMALVWTLFCGAVWYSLIAKVNKQIHNINKECSSTHPKPPLKLWVK